MGFMGIGITNDSYRETAPAIISTVPASGVVNNGTPVRRNYLATQGQNPGAANFNPSLGLTGGDQVAVPATSTAGGWLYGVYSGPTIVNSSTTATSVVTPNISRAGVTPTIVGAASGGTAVTVGSIIGMNVLQAASGGVGIGVAAGAGFGTVLTAMATTVGSILGPALGYQIITNFASAITAGTSVACNPLNTAGLGIGTTASPSLIVNPGGTNQETVVLSSIAAGSCTQLNIGWANASAGPANMIVLIGNASTGAIPLVPGGIIGVTVAFTTATTGANFATSVGAALNAAFAVYGECPPNVPGVGGIRPFGIATAATSNLSITAAYPTPAFNAVAVSVGPGTSTMTYPTSLGATSLGNYPICYGTFAQNHAAGEPVVGIVATSGATLCPVPQPGGVNIAMAMVDLSSLK